MDISTGKSYATRDEAINDGAHPSNLAHVRERIGQEPEVRFENGPFKDRVYKRDPWTGNLVRVR